MSENRTDERNEFLTDVMIGAVEHYGYGFPQAIEYVWDVPPGQAYAVITDRYEGDGKQYRLDMDVIAKGLGVIRNAVMKEIGEGYYALEQVLHNASTGDRLYLSEERRKAIMAADRDNDASGGEHGDDLDVCDYLAIVECALFGQVVYG